MKRAPDLQDVFRKSVKDWDGKQQGTLGEGAQLALGYVKTKLRGGE